MSFERAVHKKAIEIGKLSVESTTAAGSGHPSTALSLAHLTTVLMYHQMHWDPEDPWNPGNDRLVLSEGHAVPIIYAAYADLGGVMGKTKAEARAMTREDALTLRAIESPVDGHPHPEVGFPFFDAATGSLGQGLSVAAGLGAAAKMDGVAKTIYCIIGDGESREGQIWEAMDFIADHALTNVVTIFNCNELAQSDWVSPQQSADVLAAKCEAFGFTTKIIDGHDPDDIMRAFRELNIVRNGSKPMAIVARTVKGWGSPSEQGMGKHGQAVKGDKLKQIFAELDATAAGLGVNGEAVEIKIPEPVAADAQPTGAIKAPPIAEGLAMAGLGDNYTAGKPIAPRKAYGAAVLALASVDSRIIGLDADVKNSTFAEYIAKKRPAQFLECRIAEQNMISAAAGAAAAGKIPFASTFAKFFVRAYDQIEMAIISGANFKMVGSHVGVTLAADGPSQMALCDAAFFRAFCHTKNFNGDPSVRYFFPADAVATYKLTELMANLNGACYMRTLRADTKPLYKETDTFEEGGYKVVREGSDLVMVTAGYMVYECMDAADKLGKKVTIVDAYSMPLKAAEIVALAEKNGGKIVTVEDNYVGGIEAEIASAIATTGSSVKQQSIVCGRIPKSGRTPADVLKYLDLDADSIVKAIG